MSGISLDGFGAPVDVVTLRYNPEKGITVHKSADAHRRRRPDSPRVVRCALRAIREGASQQCQKCGTILSKPCDFDPVKAIQS